MYEFYFASCMDIIFNYSLLAQLVKYNVHTTRKIKSTHAIFYHTLLLYCYLCVCMCVCVCSIRLDIGQCLQVTEPYSDVPTVTPSQRCPWSDGNPRCSPQTHQSSVTDPWSWQLWPGVHRLFVLLSYTADCQLPRKYQVIHQSHAVKELCLYGSRKTVK